MPDSDRGMRLERVAGRIPTHAPYLPCCVAARRRFANKDPLLGSGTDNVLAAPAGGAWTVSDIAADWSEIYPRGP